MRDTAGLAEAPDHATLRDGLSLVDISPLDYLIVGETITSIAERCLM